MASFLNWLRTGPAPAPAVQPAPPPPDRAPGSAFLTRGEVLILARLDLIEKDQIMTTSAIEHLTASLEHLKGAGGVAQQGCLGSQGSAGGDDGALEGTELGALADQIDAQANALQTAVAGPTPAPVEPAAESAAPAV